MPKCLIKVDIKKAFDTISWEFLEAVLRGLNFPLKFISWLMECISNTSFSIDINGSLEGHFKGERGLRQGDPISPFLFVLGMEYLSRMLKTLHANPDFYFHTKCGKHKITYLAFADDLLLLSKGEYGSVSAMIRILQDFGNISGLRSNVAKSQIFFAGLSNEGIAELRALTGLSQGQFPFRYLGVPIAGYVLRSTHFGNYLMRIAAYTTLWNIKTLSYAGRIELIKGVLQGIHAFWMGILPIPAGVHKLLGKFARNFLWGNKENQHKKA